MTDASPFDQAWEQWRRDLTSSLMSDADGVSTQVRRVLAEVEARDPMDGLIKREWALGLMTEADEQIGLLRTQGLNSEQIADLVAFIRRHPLPAAGG